MMATGMTSRPSLARATLACVLLCACASRAGALRLPAAVIPRRAGAALERRSALAGGGAALAALVLAPLGASARPEGVNKPELLPRELVNVIDLQKWLTAAERGRLDRLVTSLERDTGYRLRVLTQRYPETPGAALKDYWAVDTKTIVLVADLGVNGRARANVLNFNVGADVPLPNSFWSRLQSKYGNQFFVKDNGIDQAIMESAGALADCLRRGEPYCAAPPLSVSEFL